MSKQELLDALRSEQAMAEYLEVLDDGEIISDIRTVISPGLSRRDYFAAAALTGLLASGSYNETHESDAASDALGYADALIAASKSEAHHG